ncbi:hypothetical protein ACQP3L_36500, partial [Escherichia coli]
LQSSALVSAGPKPMTSLVFPPKSVNVTQIKVIIPVAIRTLLFSVISSKLIFFSKMKLFDSWILF